MNCWIRQLVLASSSVRPSIARDRMHVVAGVMSLRYYFVSSVPLVRRTR
jgi:hypothetical protein